MDFHCDHNVPKILVGNKDDDNNQANKIVLTRYAQELAEENKLLFFETSVKDNKNVNEVFNKISKLALKRRLAEPRELLGNVSIKPNSSIPHEPNKSCCSM